ncbi:MAG: repeat domain protein [Myxococcaceae bacterium]|nr:repeat domain protein [Myxococcaceae bacterium]
MRRLVTSVLLVSLAAIAPACSSETFATATSLDGGTGDSGSVDGGPDANADACATPPCTPPTPGEVVTVVTGQGGVDGLVVTPTVVAWATPFGARTCPLTGACPQPFTLLETQLVGTLAATGEGLFMPDVNGASGVIQCTTGQRCTGGTIGNSLGDLHALVADGKDTFVIDAQAPRIAHCDTPTGCGSTWQTLGTGLVNQGSALAVTATRLFWTLPSGANGAVFSCLRSGCAPSPFATAQANPRRLAADSKSVFWTNYDDGSVWGCPLEGCAAAAKPIATGQNAPLPIATDGAHVYWATYASGTLMRCEAEGCVTPILLASGLTNPTAIALSSTDVYVASTIGGTVVKIAK